MKKPLLYLLILVVAVLGSSCSQSSEGTFEVGKNTFLLNGKPFVVKAAKIHYPRIPKDEVKFIDGYPGKYIVMARKHACRRNIGNIVLKCARHWV